uniref:Uncharacterized protein n=1 Tax=Arundo donax TaxID=35708 RepID=A0A0A8ZRC5_ARUDO
MLCCSCASILFSILLLYLWHYLSLNHWMTR